MTIDEALQQAAAHQQAGEWPQAEALYRAILETDPAHGLTHHLMGALALQFRQPEVALQHCAAALQALPDDAGVHNNTGLVLLELGRNAEAEQHLARACALAPQHTEVLRNHGLSLQALGRQEQAENRFRESLSLAPENVNAINNLGHLLLGQRRLEEAGACFERALTLFPQAAALHNNRGIVEQELGRLDEAEAAFARAIALSPEFAEAHNNLGITLTRLGRAGEAHAAFARALTLNGNYPQAQNNLGLVLQDLGRFTEAEAAFRRALELWPDYPEAWNNLGNAQRRRGQPDSALESYRQALQRRPDWPAALSNLLFALACNGQLPDTRTLELARRFGRLASQQAGTPMTQWPCQPQAQVLRIGLVSGDLREHPVAYFLEQLLAHADRQRIEFMAYASSHEHDDMSLRLREHLAGWRVIAGMDDARAAAQIASDGVHILLDLSGHTGHNRLPLFARRPAPLQGSWLGYFATTGVAQIDFVLMDRNSVPERAVAQFIESVHYLPGTRLCFTPPRQEVPVAPLPALQRGHLTFGSFQGLGKISDEVLRLWARVLRAVPDARLRLQCAQWADPLLASDVTVRLRRLGVDSQRLSLHGEVSRAEYLAAHAEIDIVLDTFPYPGGTTTCEALWMGVPTLTLSGQSCLARQGASLLAAAGLTKWIATDAQALIALAVHHAAHLPALAELRRGLREQVRHSMLMDGERFAGHFATAMHTLWAAHLAKG